MPLSPATRFGPYEIVAPLGAGGMGEVYRARDTRLGRDVALKVLPAEVSADPARRARCEQEARAAAALNHPNIVGTHDVGDQDGVFYIVSELVPGDTLSALLEQGPLPTRKLLDIAVQIADGMAAAHAARITHRDLKPANVIVTPDGRAKILDFGLAKQTFAASATGDETVALTVQHTQPGMILGTVSYMSPEQARGKPADYRSDQFSFGVILYEMASGKKAFDKPESVQTMSAILTEDPPPIERDIPAPLRWTIDRCLAKDPRDRYESSGDLFRELRQIRDYVGSKSASQIAPAAAPVKTRRRIRPLFPIVGTLGMIAAFAVGRYFTEQRFPDQAAYRFTPFAFDPGGQGSPVWSPDGKAVAYSGHPGGASAPSQVMVRYLDAAMPQQVTRLPEDSYPIAWAPDSMRILFRTDHAPAGIWSASTVGGEPESFFAAPDSLIAAVSPDLKTVAMIRRDANGVYGLWSSSPPGAPPKPYTPDPIHARALYNESRLRFSPDGKSILLLMRTDRGADEIWVVPFPSGSPKRILENVRSYSGTPEVSWMPDGRRLVISASPELEAPPQLWLADSRSGAVTAITSGTTSRRSPAVSPDGSRVLFAEATRDFDVISLDLERGSAERLIATERGEAMPAWAANARALVYVSDRRGPREIWFRDHAGDRPVVTQQTFPDGRTEWFMGPALSPDGARIAYTRIEFGGSDHLWISSPAGGAPVRLTNDPSSAEFPGSWSPDGNWFVYSAIRNGSQDLMKAKTSGQAAPVLVKAGVDCETPSWSPDDKWLLCTDLISTDGQTVRPLPKIQTRNYAFSGDGKLLYGLREEPDALTLFSIDIASGTQKNIGRLDPEFRPQSDLHPAIRLSLAPDGKSLVYAAAKYHSNLWTLSGAVKP
jgi:eukaryotic-like serine/threonine-protein kinase